MTQRVDIAVPGALTAALGLDSRQIGVKLAVLAALARAKWIRVAQEGLRSTSQQYIAGIQPERVYNVPGQDAEATIALTGGLPNDLEWGRPAYDLRDTVLKSAKARTSSKGYRYLSVPFRHMGPKATGRNAPPIGSAYKRAGMEADAVKALQRSAWNAAKRLQASSQSMTGTKWGGSLPASRGGPLLREHHTTGIYTGMYRVQKTYEKKRQSYYMTFRTISTNPATMDGAKWMHPGLKPRRFMLQVRDYVEREAPNVFAANAGGAQ